MLDQGDATRGLSQDRLVRDDGWTRVFRTAPHSEDSGPGLLRVLDPGAPDPERQCFVEEYLLLQRIRHPNWPASASYRVTPHGPAIFLPNVPGTPLSSCRFAIGWDSERREICRQLLSALDALHRAGRYHGKLTPEHVFLDRARDGGPSSPHLTLVDLGDLVAGDVPFEGALPRSLFDPGPPGGRDGSLFAQLAFGLLAGSLDAAAGGYDWSGVERRLTGVPRDVRRLLADLASQPEEAPSMLSIWESLRRIPASGGAARTSATTSSERLARTSTPRFVGRDTEIRQFREWIAKIETENRPPARCIVYGEEGLGRHALAQQLVAHAETRGWISAGKEPEDMWSLAFPSAGQARLLAVQVEAEYAQSEPSPPSERSSDPETKVAPVPITLPIRLARLSGHELTTLAATRISSHPLIERATRISLQSPGLLESLLAEIPELVDSISREHPGTLLEARIESSLPPRGWVEWAARCSRTLEPECRRAVVAMAVAGTAWPIESVQNLCQVRIPGGRSYTDLVDRQLIDSSSDPPKLSSPLWDSAWLAAEPELAREIALALLSELPHHATLEMLVRACRFAIDLALWNKVSDLLDRSLIRLRESGRHTTELQLIAHAIEHAPADTLFLRPDHLLAIARSFLWCDRWEASLLPASFAEGRFPTPLSEPLETALLTWARLAGHDDDAARTPLPSAASEAVSIVSEDAERSQQRSMSSTEDPASRDLCRLTHFSLAPPNLEWLFAYLATRRPETLRGATADWVLGLASHPRFDGKVERGHLCSAVLRYCTVESSARRTEILIEMLHHAGWPDGIRAGLVHLYQSEIAHLDGASADARAEARRAEDIFRRLESWSHHLRTVKILAELAFEEGDLAQAYRQWRRCLQTALELKQWRAAHDFAYRMTRCAIVRGDFSQATAACHRVRDLQDLFGVGAPADLLACELELALQAGNLDVLLSREHSLDDAPWLLRAHGLAELLAGHHDEGRILLELASERMLASNPAECAELLIDWLIAETDLLEPELALTLYDRAAELAPKLGTYGRARFFFAQSGLTARGWMDEGTSLEGTLLKSAMLSHNTDSGSTTWRCHWDLSLYHKRGGEVRLQRESLVHARQSLEQVANTLPRSLRFAFLALPGPRTVLSRSA